MGRLEILNAAKERMGRLAFGEPVTNVCAGQSNPLRHVYFVEHVRKSKKTFGGFPYTEHWAKCTDRNGKFWNIDIKVIYPGHLDAEECARLFAPIWESEYGPKKTATSGATP